MAPNRDGSFPILASSELATGAWTFLGGGRYTNNGFLTPIGGFYGALTANGSYVRGSFSIASNDGPPNYNYAQCLGDTYFLDMVGAVHAGRLTLDSDFAGNHLHLIAQLTSDRRAVASGSYEITGSCATNAPQMTGFWSPPVTGTFAGHLISASGAPELLTAHLVQGNSFNQMGYIPVTGSASFAHTGCTVSYTLQDGDVVGSTMDAFGMSYAASSNLNAGFTGDLDPQSKNVLLEFWDYGSDPACGDSYSDPTNPGTLVRQ